MGTRADETQTLKQGDPLMPSKVMEWGIHGYAHHQLRFSRTGSIRRETICAICNKASFAPLANEKIDTPMQHLRSLL